MSNALACRDGNGYLEDPPVLDEPRAIRDVVYPAYTRVADALDGQLSKSRSTDGVWALPNGEAYYRYLVRHHTGTDMTPEEMHNLGLEEVQRIRGEMQTLLNELGQGGKSFRDAMSAAAQASGVYDLTKQGEKDRLWDMVWLLRGGIGRGSGGRIRFAVHVRNDNRKGTPPLVQLKAICGPGDEGAPVVCGPGRLDVLRRSPRCL